MKLIAKDGKLYIPNSAIADECTKEWYDGEDVIVMVKYGLDADTIPWPFPKAGDATLARVMDETGYESYKSFHRRSAAIYWHKTPNKLRDALAHALYDDRETGVLPADCKVVILPDGMAFEIDTAKFYCPECDRDEGQGHDKDNGCTVWEDNANV